MFLSLSPKHCVFVFLKKKKQKFKKKKNLNFLRKKKKKKEEKKKKKKMVQIEQKTELIYEQVKSYTKCSNLIKSTKGSMVYVDITNEEDANVWLYLEMIGKDAYDEREEEKDKYYGPKEFHKLKKDKKETFRLKIHSPKDTGKYYVKACVAFGNEDISKTSLSSIKRIVNKDKKKENVEMQYVKVYSHRSTIKNPYSLFLTSERSKRKLKEIENKNLKIDSSSSSDSDDVSSSEEEDEDEIIQVQKKRKQHNNQDFHSKVDFKRKKIENKKSLHSIINRLEDIQKEINEIKTTIEKFC